ncbi:hypothetical protein ANTQUA_LOCUS7255 [Anthophora quadrimaculata]
MTNTSTKYLLKNKEENDDVINHRESENEKLQVSIMQYCMTCNIVSEIISNSRGIGGHLRKVAVEFRANGTPCIRVVV